MPPSAPRASIELSMLPIMVAPALGSSSTVYLPGSIARAFVESRALRAATRVTAAASSRATSSKSATP